MRTYNIHEAKTHLSRLIDEAAAGEPFVIAKAGKPMAKVISIDASQDRATRRIGFLKGKIKVPDNFDTMMAGEIQEMFYGKNEIACGHPSVAWAVEASPRLPRIARKLISAPANELIFSVASIWEISIKHAKGLSSFHPHPGTVWEGLL